MTTKKLISKEEGCCLLAILLLVFGLLYIVLFIAYLAEFSTGNVEYKCSHFKAKRVDYIVPARFVTCGYIKHVKPWLEEEI